MDRLEIMEKVAIAMKTDKSKVETGKVKGGTRPKRKPKDVAVMQVETKKKMTTDKKTGKATSGGPKPQKVYKDKNFKPSTPAKKQPTLKKKKVVSGGNFTPTPTPKPLQRAHTGALGNTAGMSLRKKVGLVGGGLAAAGLAMKARSKYKDNQEKAKMADAAKPKAK